MLESIQLGCIMSTINLNCLLFKSISTKYAFVGLPLAEFMEGGGVNSSNIGVGRICLLDENLPADSFVQGVVILTSRANALASWLAGTEIAGIKADLRKRELVMETDIDNQ